jgi:hypothetical protein
LPMRDGGTPVPELLEQVPAHFVDGRRSASIWRKNGSTRGSLSHSRSNSGLSLDATAEVARVS